MTSCYFASVAALSFQWGVAMLSPVLLMRVTTMWMLMGGGSMARAVRVTMVLL